jgi:multidrug efflux pump subunit AcrA (membrane-fusion protein)
MFARGAVIVSRKNNVILVPKAALATAGNPIPLSSTETGTASSVFTMQDGKTVRKNIRVGEPSGDNVEVISGLEPGDQVIVSGSRLEEGQKVHVTH